MWWTSLGGRIIPLGFHTEPSPYPGVESARVEGVAGAAARAIARGQEALGRMIVPNV